MKATLALAFALGAALTSPAFARDGGKVQTDTYCGVTQFGEIDDLTKHPIIDGLLVNYSTNAKVRQVIEKFGSHSIEFTYIDAPHFRRISATVAGDTHVCIEAKAFELSRWGTPVVVLPTDVIDVE